MSDLLQFKDDQELYEIHDAEGMTGALMHLATLEFDQNTYLALGTLQQIEYGVQGGIVIVKEVLDEDGKKGFEVVHEEKELTEIVPRFIEAFFPNAQIKTSMNVISSEDVEYEDNDGKPNPFVFGFNDENSVLQ